MMNERHVGADDLRQGRSRLALGLMMLSGVAICAGAARAAEPVYPFEGSWVAANRACVAGSPHVRIYTQHEVTSRSGRCSIKKVASGSGLFEIFEDCRHSERPGDYTETIRMIGSDAMQMKRQSGRLKIARGARYLRCSAAGSGAKPPSPSPSKKPGAGSETQTQTEEPPKP